MLSLLRMRLHHTIGLWSTSGGEIESKQAGSVGSERVTNGVMAQAIPLKRIGSATSIVYACAIAHQLAANPHQSAAIATQLADSLRLDLASSLEPFLQDIMVEATTAGFIDFKVGDRAIASWLNLLLTALPQQPLPMPPMGDKRQQLLQASALFEVQHAHARCCSLLHLAHCEGLIVLEPLETPHAWRISSPAALPWLTSADQLCVQHPADRALLVQLVDTYDYVDQPQQHTQASVLRSAQALAQTFQTFHRVHPLFAGVEDASLTEVRLGLLMITQRVLALLLQEGLDICPAVSL